MFYLKNGLVFTFKVEEEQRVLLLFEGRNYVFEI